MGCLSFSVRCHRKTQMNFLANPITQQKGTQWGGGKNDERQIHVPPPPPRKPEWLWNESTRYYKMRSETWSWKGSNIPKKQANPRFPFPSHTAKQVYPSKEEDAELRRWSKTLHMSPAANTSPFPHGILKPWKPASHLSGKRLENSLENWMDPEDVGIWVSTSENSRSPQIPGLSEAKLKIKKCCLSLDGREVRGRMDTCIHMTECIRFSPESITALLISYIPIENKKLKKKKSLSCSGDSDIENRLMDVLGCLGGRRGWDVWRK